MQIFESKPVGRPRVNDPHAIGVQLRFTRAELARIDAYAAQLSEQTGKLVSRSAAIRALALAHLAQETVSIER